MKILFLGDIVGKIARDKVKENISSLKTKFSPDVIIANAENASGGYGLSKKDAQDLLSSGIDVLTLGNHAWDQREMLTFIEECPKIVRAINYPEGVPGKGFYSLELINGKKIIVLQVMLRLFMSMSLDDPFSTTRNFLLTEKLGSTCDSIIVDVHGEASSEKMALGVALDGYVSAVVGTHTHVPTADHQILENGTAFITDVGMSGDYNSIIGMNKKDALNRFKFPDNKKSRLEVSIGEPTLCGVIIESDTNGLSKSINPLRLGGKLDQTILD